MYNALLYGNDIDAILEEFFTGIKSMEIKDKFRKLTIAKVIWNKRALGVVYRNSLFMPYISQCTQVVIKLLQNDVHALAINYLQSTEVRNIYVEFQNRCRLKIMSSLRSRRSMGRGKGKVERARREDSSEFLRAQISPSLVLPLESPYSIDCVVNSNHIFTIFVKNEKNFSFFNRRKGRVSCPFNLI